jgi:SOS response regulatory protein OraA/RecX
MKSSKKWSDAEMDGLKEKGFVPDRTANALRYMKNRLGLRTRRETRLPWTKEDIEKLRELIGKGFSARSIHKMGLLSFSVNAIQKQMCRLGLAKKMNVFKFSPEVKNKFKNFLAEQWEGKIPEDLVEIWNRENAKHPTNKGKVVSYLTLLKLKIPYGEVQKIKNLRKKIEKIQCSVGTSANTLEKIRLERVNLMRQRAERSRDIWSGLPIEICPED